MDCDTREFGTRNARTLALLMARAVFGGLSLVSCAAHAGCKLSRIAELPVTMSDSRPLVTAKINGSDAEFMADSGSALSLISGASAAEFKLRTRQAPFELRVVGYGGDASVELATVKTFTLAGVDIHNVEFLVGGSEVGAGSVGTLGQNVLQIADVEYDLANGAIRLMRADGCRHAELAYWTTTGAHYSEMEFNATSRMEPQTVGVASINGVKIRVLFDTGATRSILSLHAAKKAGITIDAAGVIDGGNWRGIGRGTIKTWIAPFASFKIGDEEIRNTHLRVGEFDLDLADMSLGEDFFLSHRVYVASSQHKVYFTYNGGPVFNLSATPATAPPATAKPATAPPGTAPPATEPRAVAEAAPATEPRAAAEPAATTQGASPAESPAAPKDAEEFNRRGVAYASRGDLVHALADLDKACELAPGEANYFYERGRIRLRNHELTPAMSDYDQAIRLKPDHVPALIARAELRLQQNRDAPQGLEDLNAADHAASQEADARLQIGFDYVLADLLASAVTQLDLWIAAHGADVRLADALDLRCRAKAFLGQDLNKALSDCNSAIKLRGKSDGSMFASRGIAHLRLGDYAKSIADFDASVKLDPKDAWAFYGRGVAKNRSSNGAAGQADIDTALTLAPGVANYFNKYGIVP